jgi:hypothetical protein
MRAGLDSGQALKRVAVLVAGAAVGLAACSSPAASAPATAAAPTAAAPSAAAPSTEASGAAASPSVAIVNNDPLNLAYISFAVQNSYDAPMWRLPVRRRQQRHADGSTATSTRAPGQA